MNAMVKLLLSCSLLAIVVSGLTARAAQTPPQGQRPTLAVVVVLDRSGSMAGSKLNLAKEATKNALALLGEKDSFGVLAFDYRFQWAVKVAAVQNKDDMRNAVDGILATGNTNVYPALHEAYQQLRAVPADAKHIILLSDGQTPAEDFQTLTAEMLKDKITVSTVALTTASDRELLRNIAMWGGGRAYYVDTPQGIPDIFREDTERAAGRQL